MSAWHNIKGTTYNSFSIFKKILFSPGTNTGLRTITFPDADVNMSGGSTGQALVQQPSGALAMATITASALTVIANGGTLGGTISGDVYLEGSASLSSNTVIKGTLFGVGPLTNAGGYSLDIQKDVILQKSLLLSPAASTAGNDCIFRGDVILGYDGVSEVSIEFKQNVAKKKITIEGDIEAWTLDLSGDTDCAGSDIEIYGNATGKKFDLGDQISGVSILTNGIGYAKDGGSILVLGTVSNYALSTKGSPSDTTGNTGAGGNITCGNIFSRKNNIDLSGGNFIDAHTDDGAQGGKSGDLVVHGDLVCHMLNSLGGGSVTDVSDTIRHGGDAGTINIFGLCDAGITSRGGNAHGISPAKPGSGAMCFFYKDLTNYFNGFPQTFSSGACSNITRATNNPNITVYGSVLQCGIDISGLPNQSGARPCSGSHAGSIIIYGDMCEGAISAIGGDSANFDGTESPGDGGSISVAGNCYSFGDIIADAGNGVLTNSPGTPGAIYVAGHTIANEIRSNSTDVIGDAHCKNGGNITLAKDVYAVSSLAAIGGSNGNINALPFNGGNGGYINIGGKLQTGTLDASGGSSLTGLPGNGGYIHFQNDTTLNSAVVNGGTAVSPNLSAGGAGGTLNFNHKISFIDVGALLARGGNSDQGNGGAGGTITINGTVTDKVGSLISTEGGSSTTNGAGGNGGPITFNSHVTVKNVYSSGGAAAGSYNGGDAGPIIIRAGIACDNVKMEYGAGIGTPSTVVMYVGGYCSIRSLDWSQNYQVQPLGSPGGGFNIQTVLMADAGGFKNVLTNTGGTDVTTALSSTYMFYSQGGTTWYYIAGTAA